MSRLDQVCESKLQTQFDSCDQLSANTFYYIEISALSDVHYNLIAAFAVNLGVDSAATGSVVRDNSDFYRVTGADAIVLHSQSGDADLRVFQTPSMALSTDSSLLVCESALGESDDICDPLDSVNTYYVEALGFTDVSYVLYAETSESYAIGDTGPAGGIVFYVDPGYASRGLEAAPEDQEAIDDYAEENTRSVIWGCGSEENIQNITDISSPAEDEIGNGAINTAAYLDQIDCGYDHMGFTGGAMGVAER